MIAKMLKFHLFFIGDEDKILKELQKAGFIEITPIKEEYGFKNIEERIISVEENLNKLEFLKGLLKKVEKREFNEKILLDEKQENTIISSFSIDQTYRTFKNLNDEIERRKAIDRKIDNLLKSLENIENIRINFSYLFSLKNFSFFLISSRKPISIDLEDILVEKISQRQKEIFYLLIFPKEKKEQIAEILSNQPIEIIEVKRWNKYPGEIIEKLKKTRQKNLEKIHHLEKKLEELKIEKNKIFVVYDHYLSLLEYLKTKERLGFSKFVKVFCGWVKEKDLNKLKNFIKEHIPDSFINISPPQDDEEIPIELENPVLIKPFEVVTDLYGRPVYKNIDPTSPLSLFFVISFGFCLTDAGYGILLIILSMLLMKKFKYFPTFHKFLKLLMYGGIGTFIMGAITGGWFGDVINYLPESSFAYKTLNSLVILNPMKGGNSAFIFLAWALILGFIQIICGLLLNVYNSIKNKEKNEIIISFSSLLIQVFVGLVAFLFIKGIKSGVLISISLLIIVLSFLTIMFTNAISQKGFMMKMFWAVYSVYTIIASNLLGDVLSYSRLFGLGLTTAVLGLVVNQIVLLAKGIPFVGPLLAGILFLTGHFGNMAINLLGGYVHTSRLQYLEFFTKFYKSGGRPFTPFSEKRVYTYIEKF